jgi:hypothetical protein
MIFKRVSTILIFIICNSNYNLKAQENKNKLNMESINKGASYLKFSLNYVSDAVFMGRRDSVALPYFNPSFIYQHKSGLFLSSSISYLVSNDANRIDLYTVSGGYDMIKETFNAGISVTGYLFDNESYHIKSSLTTEVGAYAGFLTSAVNIYTSGSFFIGDEIDFFAGVDINKSINISKNKFYITPSFTANAGSLHFYNSYFQTQGYGKRKGKLSNTAINSSSIIIADVKKFKLLELTLSSRFDYSFRNLEFIFIPIFSIPQSESNILVNDLIEKENFSPFLFWSAGISYQF